MVTVYRPGTGPWHRLAAGPKLVVLLIIVLGVCLLPGTWWAAGVAAAVCVIVYAPLEDGMRQLVRQLVMMRWVIAVMLAGQLIFLGPEPAAGNTMRVVAAMSIAALLMLTTRVSDVLDVLERGLTPLRLVKVDPQRVALLLTITLSTLPVLARLAREVLEAQRARGGRGNLRLFAMPFLVVALKHADELGDALTARGVR